MMTTTTAGVFVFWRFLVARGDAAMDEENREKAKGWDRRTS
jgi:hypothetical protein